MADHSTCLPLTARSIEAAHQKIKSYIHETPLITSKAIDAIASHPTPSSFLSSIPPPLSSPISNRHGNIAAQAPKFNLYFKAECLQKIGAFKARGAYHALTHLIASHGIDKVKSKGVITHSSGNHAQALALAASTFDVRSYIIMPTISTPSKIAGTQLYTDNVIFSGSTSDEREAKVKETQEQTGAILVPPYDHPDIILGQGTAAYEMSSQLQNLKTDPTARFDAVIAPLGGGGLLSGTATWFSETAPTSTVNGISPSKHTLVFGAEPSFQGANDAQKGLSSNPPTRIPHVKSLTIADGLRTPVGLIPWSIISDKSKVQGVYSVSDNEIKMALKLMMERTKLFLEPSAVVGLAVILFCKEFRAFVAQKQAEENTGRAWDVGVVLSGGNTTVQALSKLFAEENTKEEEARETGMVGSDGKQVAEDVAG